MCGECVQQFRNACIVNLFESVNVTDVDCRPNNLNIVQYGSSTLCGNQFVNQENLYSPPLLCNFFNKQYVMQYVMNYLI
jgi:hypothetical protein